jgi:hypothetical protein
LDGLLHLHQSKSHGSLDLEHVLLRVEGDLKVSCVGGIMTDSKPNWPKEWESSVEDPKSIDTYCAILIFLCMVGGTKVLQWFTPSSLLELWTDRSPATSGRGHSRDLNNFADENSNLAERKLDFRETQEILSRLPKSLKDLLRSVLTHTNNSLTHLSNYFGALSRRAHSFSLGSDALHEHSMIDPTLLASNASIGVMGTLRSYSSQYSSNLPDASTVTQLSRYKSDFEEIEYIGRGGFGQVVKAKNKLDGRMYAIKTVRLSRDSNDNRKLLREVRTLSRLNSVRCVRYYQAWIEDSQGTRMEDSEDEDDDSGEAAGSSVTSGDIDTADDFASEDSHDADSYLSRISSNYGTQQNIEVGNDWISFEGSSSLPRANGPRKQAGSIADRILRRPDTDDYETSNHDAQPSSKFLYIQMEYCENRTLSDVIELGVNEAEAWRLFREIVDGLVHIHSQAMIHRDLKPYASPPSDCIYVIY